MVSTDAKKQRLHKNVEAYVDYLNQDISRLDPLVGFLGKHPVRVELASKSEDFRGMDMRIIYEEPHPDTAQHKGRFAEKTSNSRAGKDIPVELARYYTFFVGPGDCVTLMDGGRDVWQIPSDSLQVSQTSSEWSVLRDWDATRIETDLYVVKPDKADYTLWCRKSAIKKLVDLGWELLQEIWKDESVRERIQASVRYDNTLYLHPFIKDSRWPKDAQIIAKRDVDKKRITFANSHREDKFASVGKANLYIPPWLIENDYVKIEGVPQ